MELGTNDETLEMPWAAGPGGPKYCDVKRHPELLVNIEEARDESPLAEFLKAINSPASPLETAKCDTWSTDEMSVEDEIFAARQKFGCYVDLVFSDEKARSSFASHEDLATEVTRLLRKAPEIPAAAEFLVRRCYYHVGQEVREGFYLTFYLFGYGDDESQAHEHWAIALKLVENAIRQAAR